MANQGTFTKNLKQVLIDTWYHFLYLGICLTALGFHPLLYCILVGRMKKRHFVERYVRTTHNPLSYFISVVGCCETRGNLIQCDQVGHAEWQIDHLDRCTGVDLGLYFFGDRICVFQR